MRLYWLDLETEGLEPSDCAILEVAVSVADLAAPFDAVAAYHTVLQMTPEAVEALRVANPHVHAMHTKNGLLAECAASRLSFLAVERALLEVVPEVADREDRPTLAGSSVHFDHGFLRYWMPALAARFSHRHYDVSAVKLFCQSLGMPKLPRAEAHRAKDDVLESVAHARLCAGWLQYELPAVGFHPRVAR
jgi:oligoribonuclease (3'-5' exoribonuclease)